MNNEELLKLLEDLYSKAREAGLVAGGFWSVGDAQQIAQDLGHTLTEAQEREVMDIFEDYDVHDSDTLVEAVEEVCKPRPATKSAITTVTYATQEILNDWYGYDEDTRIMLGGAKR